MSYILDALKKTELEKNRKTDADGKTNISAALFNERRPSHSKIASWKILSLFVIASILTSAATWIILKKDHGKKSSINKAAMPQIVPSASKPTVPAPAVPTIPTSSDSRQAIATPPTVKKVVALPVVENHQQSYDDEPSPKNSRKASSRAAVEKKVTPVFRPSTPLTIPAPADIKLSGIAWQEQHSGRRAVINGLLLKEGVVVSGAKITDIQTDKVRFSTPNGIFEIKFDAATNSEPKK